jgi:hypothetical protein
VTPHVSPWRERFSLVLSSALASFGLVGLLDLDSENVGLAAALAWWVLGTAVFFALAMWGTAIWRRKTGG